MDVAAPVPTQLSPGQSRHQTQCSIFILGETWAALARGPLSTILEQSLMHDDFDCVAATLRSAVADQGRLADPIEQVLAGPAIRQGGNSRSD